MNQVIKKLIESFLLIGLSLITFFCKEKSTLPTVTTNSITEITSTTATTGGIVTDDGGAEVTLRGVCWNTSENPSTSNFKTSDGSGTGSYKSSLGDLAPNTKYFVKAYSTNKIGTSYGSQLSFITGTFSAVILTTTSVTTIAQTSAVSGGNITSDGGGSITARGVCWGTTPNPTIDNYKTNDGSGTGNFTSNITGLSPGTKYYIRSYATNIAGITYGDELTFTTLSDLSVIFHFIDEPANILSGIIGEIDNANHHLKLEGVANPSTSRYVFFNTNEVPITNIKTAIFEADLSLPTGLRVGIQNSSDPCGDQSNNSVGTPILFRIWFTWNTCVEISMQSLFGFNLEQVLNGEQPLSISRNGGLARPGTTISNWSGGRAGFDPLELIQLASVGAQFHVKLSADLEQSKVMAEIAPKIGFEERFRPLPPGSEEAIAAPFVAITNLVDWTKDATFNNTIFFGIAVRTNGNNEVDNSAAPGGSLRYIHREFSNVQVSYNQPIYFPSIPALFIPSDDFNDGSASLYWEFNESKGLNFIEQDGTLSLSGISGVDGAASLSNIAFPRQNITVGLDFMAPTGIQDNTLCMFRVQFDGYNYFQVQITSGGYYLVRCINNQIDGIGNSMPLFGDETTKFHHIKITYNNTTGDIQGFVDEIQLSSVDKKLFPESLTTFRVTFYSFAANGQNIVRMWDNFTFSGVKK